MGRSYNHWSEAEVSALKEGVARFGVGSWQKIVNDYPVLRQRTGVQLKDKYRNMIKFRHIATNEVPPPPPPAPRRSGSTRSAAARRSPTPAAAEPAVSSQPRTSPSQTQQQQVMQPQLLPPPPHQQQQSAAGNTSASGLQPAREQQGAALPPLTAQKQQERLAVEQAVAQQRLQQAQAACKVALQAYVQSLAAAAVSNALAAAAASEAAEAAAAGQPAGGLQQSARLQQQQAEVAQQLLAAAQLVYLQAGEDLHHAQATANAAVSAVLLAAETAADQAPFGGMLPVADGRVAAAVVRHSNRRKAALNRKRFLDEDVATEDEPPSRPRSAQGAVTAASAPAGAVTGVVLEKSEGEQQRATGASGGAAGGKRRRVGAQKRLHEDTRFGIYDDRRYRGDAAGSDGDAPVTQRRRTTSSSVMAAAAVAAVAAHSSGGNNRGRTSGNGGTAAQQRRRRRRRPRHLSSEFALSDEDEDEYEFDAELAEAELADADKAEEEWQRQFNQEQRDVDCLCGVSYDDGEEMVECESCGVWAHISCLARYGRLRHSANRYICSHCQGGFGSPMAAGTPSAAGALSPRGIAVALAARRHAFRTESLSDELYDIAAFLDNMGPHHRIKMERSASAGPGPGSACPRSASAQQLAALDSMEAALGGSPQHSSGAGGGDGEREGGEAVVLGPAVPHWGGCGRRRPRCPRSRSSVEQHPWPSAGVTLPAAPRTKRRRLPPPHPGTAAAAAASVWQQMPLVAAGLVAAQAGLPQAPLLQLPPALPPFMPLNGAPSPLGGAPGLGDPVLGPAAVVATAAAAAAAAAAAGMSLGRSWGQQLQAEEEERSAAAAGAGGGDGGVDMDDQQERQKTAAVAELMQIMQGGNGLGLLHPRPPLPAAAASSLLGSRRPTPSPPIDLMHRDLHDADLQDDLHAQDWLAAAASLARADSQPTYPAFPVGALDGTGPTNSHQLHSLGGSPARPASLQSAPPLLAPALPPPLAQQEQQHGWLTVMSSLQQLQQQQQQQQRVMAGRREPPATSAAASAAGTQLRPPLGSLAVPPVVPPPSDPDLAAMHRRLQNLAAGVGAAAALSTATSAGPQGASTSASGGNARPSLDAVQQQDGFGRYRQGSLQSLQQLAPELQVEGLHGLTPTASARADPLLSDDDADAEGPNLLIMAAQQQEQLSPKQQRQRQQQQQQQEGQRQRLSLPGEDDGGGGGA